MHRLQNITAPSVFNPRAFFDGKRNLFSVGALKMQGDAAEVRSPCIHFLSRCSPGEARVRGCSHALVCCLFTVRGQHDGSATSREHTRSISRQADESERHVSMASILFCFFTCLPLRRTNTRRRNISRRANEIFAGGSEVSQIAVTFLQIVVRQAPML